MEKEDKSKERKEFPLKNIVPNLILKYIELLALFMYSYSKLPSWRNMPTIDELSSEETLITIKKKIEISLNILYKDTSFKGEDKQIKHVLQFCQNLFKTDPLLLSKVIKVNLLINAAITLTKLLPVVNNEKKTELIMVDYLQGIIKNFYLAYGKTDIRKLELIGNHLALIVHNHSFFDYEYFFLYEEEYIIKEYIPKLKEQTKKLIITFNEDLISEFELNCIDYQSVHSLNYYIEFLDELDKFKDYQKTHSKEEYDVYKKTIKQRISTLKE